VTATTPPAQRSEERGAAPASPAPGTFLTETVNVRTGHIRASGHLTSQGADLLSGTADHLRGNGHSRVVLDLRDVQAADDAGLDILRDLRRMFESAGDKLLIRHAPQVVGESG
jgi:anti-anti-sigma regulatory factor